MSSGYGVGSPSCVARKVEARKEVGSSWSGCSLESHEEGILHLLGSSEFLMYDYVRWYHG